MEKPRLVWPLPSWMMALAAFLVVSAALLLVDDLAVRRQISGGAVSASPATMITVAGPGMGLTQHEIDHMRYMREEEKLAHDVYISLADLWGIPVFGRIALAEQRHTEAVLRLINAYGIADPAAGKGVGEFTDPNLAQLYTTLMTKGAATPQQALLVGGLIEEVDIADLEKAVASTNRPDIIRVYNNIHRGSRNHLRSFAKGLQQMGVPYQPQKLGLAEVTAILNSPMENGPPP